MKKAIPFIGLMAALLGGRWLLQGLGIVHLQPILCLVDCTPVLGPSAPWAVIGVLMLTAGGAAALRSWRQGPNCAFVRRPWHWVAAGLIPLAIAGSAIAWLFDRDITTARAHATRGGVLIDTRCGPIEYQEAGAGVPLLAVHGSGGGHDQGMAFAGALAQHGIQVIAMSRYGYLRTPMRADASAAAQADAHVCLLDALGIGRAAVMGGSAGAPSALQSLTIAYEASSGSEGLCQIGCGRLDRPHRVRCYFADLVALQPRYFTGYRPRRTGQFDGCHALRPD